MLLREQSVTTSWRMKAKTARLTMRTLMKIWSTSDLTSKEMDASAKLKDIKAAQLYLKKRSTLKGSSETTRTLTLKFQISNNSWRI